MFFCGISFCCMTFAQKVPEGDIIKNLVVNGSFENPDKTWVPGEDWWFNPNGNMAFDGTKDDSYLQYAITPPTLRFSNDPKNMMIAQDIQVEPGETYIFSYIARIHESISISGKNPVKGDKHLDGFIQNMSVNPVKNILTVKVSSHINKVYEHEFTVPEGCTKIKVLFQKTTNGVAFLDDVKIYKLGGTDTEEPEVPAEIVPRPSLMLSNLTKELTMSEILPDTKVTITSPKGEITEFPEGSPEIKFSFEGKPTGNYTVELKGSQAKTFIINTSSLNKEE